MSNHVNEELSNGYKRRVSPVESKNRPHRANIYATAVDLDGLSWPCTLNPKTPPPLLLGISWHLAAGTKARLEATEDEKFVRQQRLVKAVREILDCLGEDPDREGLKGTPERYAQAMLYFTKGYEENMKGIFPYVFNWNRYY